MANGENERRNSVANGDVINGRGRPFEPHKRDKILDEAVKMARQVSIWNVTASSLAEWTGIARTTIIYHMGDNDELRRAVSNVIKTAH